MRVNTLKVLSICVNGMYSDGFSYHENLLPKYQKMNGNNVAIMASQFCFDENGKTIKDKREHYIDENGIEIYRLPIIGNMDISFRLKRFKGFYDRIEAEKPDIIFCHLMQFLDVDKVILYKKRHPEVKLYFDSHSDYINSARSLISREIQHKLLWRYYSHKALPYTEKFYGVLPTRVDFLLHMYKLPKEKVELLIMGADDDEVFAADKPEIKLEIRKKYGIADDDFLIVNGGKIDAYKKQTMLLMNAVNKIDNPKVKLIIFGSIAPELKEEFMKCCSERVIYIGWLESDDSYKYFSAAELVVFPGAHSVFWEQVAGQGKPMIVKYWKGIDDIDCGGNCIFLYHDSETEIKDNILSLVNNQETFDKMVQKADEERGKFSYRYLANKSIQ